MSLRKLESLKANVRIAVAVLGLFLVAACATTPTSPQGAAELRTKLSALQSDPQLAPHARVEIREAEEAVRLAERPVTGSDDEGLAAHRLYMADHKIDIARARAVTRHAEAQRGLLGEQREQARLEARTREADRAQDDAQRARSEAGQARAEAQMARDEAALSRSLAESERAAGAESEAAAAREAAELRRQIETLEAEVTNRGLVLTLGDVLFATDSTELQAGGHVNLDRLVSFLEQYPERGVHVEGHTDNVGAPDYNRQLSQRRAESVRSFLVQRGIGSARITTAGIGMDRPVASNASAGGRQMNRRVEIIIENPPQTQASADSG